MQPLHRFTVVSNVPESLRAIERVAANLHWAWDRETVQLFDRLDDDDGIEDNNGYGNGTANGQRRGSWRTSGRHPFDLVRSTSATRWAALADDEQFVNQLERADRRLSDAIDGSSWFGRRRDDGDTPLGLVAYFSPEFGITEALPQYSGGLGVLAGDHLKASCDLGVPLVGVGLLYAEGYFHQELDADGWQEERNEPIDPDGLGLVSTGVEVSVTLGDVDVAVRVWRADVGRIPLYLLDTNVASNPPEAIAVTNRLYGGDEQHRLRQEIVLGIGGVRALRALGIHPDVFHTNEGHAGFLGLERAREWTEQGFAFDEAIEAVRAGCVFTTHTPVPAGIDRFPLDLFRHYFDGFAEQCGVPVEELIALGQPLGGGDTFNMAIMGLRLAARANGVARLHGAVSREMFGELWPDLATVEVPIGHVTNGVHARSWASPQIDELLSERIGDDWHLSDATTWEAVRELDPRAVWDVRNAGRRELVDLVRARLGDDLLDPDILTIGFARRFATYKRSTLLLAQMDRLRALLLDPQRPVQFVFAGKAHPADHPGKEMIKAIGHLTREADVRHRFVFIPDYDIGIARTMYHGCDVWLNTPRRPMEACGTSGMKAALNGVLNCSIRDGWWDEMSDGSNGFDLPSFDDDHDIERRDRREATATFEVIEAQIVPRFYDRDEHGVPGDWIERIIANWTSLGWRVNAGRMVRDYVTSLYEPAATSAGAITADGGAPARELAAWKRHVRAVWDGVRVTMDASDELDDIAAGRDITITAHVDTGALAPHDIVVQAVHGPLDADGSFDETGVAFVTMAAAGGGNYSATLTPDRAGRWGVTVRATPTHPLLARHSDTALVATG